MKRALFSKGRLTCHGQRDKGASGQAAALHWSGRRVRQLPCDARSRGPVAELTSLTAFDFVQTAATSQMTMRAARAATSPVLLGAPEARCDLPGRAFPGRWCLLFVGKTETAAARQAVPGRGDFWGDEQRRPGVGARSAHRHLTRRGCLNGANEVSKVSSAARHQGEQRSAVEAQRRPLQHEPLPGTACRAEQQRH